MNTLWLLQGNVTNDFESVLFFFERLSKTYKTLTVLLPHSLRAVMTIFGKSKRKQTLLEASLKSKPIYHNSNNNNNNSNKSKNTVTDKVKHKDKYLYAQSSLNLTQPPPPYSSSAPLQPNRWPTYQGPYHTPYPYPPPNNQVSQVNLVGRPLPPPHHGMYKQDVKGKSCTNLPATLTRPAQCLSDGLDAWHNRNTDSRNPRAALCDLISSKLDTVLTLIDGERFSGDERELGMSW